MWQTQTQYQHLQSWQWYKSVAINFAMIKWICYDHAWIDYELNNAYYIFFFSTEQSEKFFSYNKLMWYMLYVLISWPSSVESKYTSVEQNSSWRAERGAGLAKWPPLCPKLKFFYNREYLWWQGPNERDGNNCILRLDNQSLWGFNVEQWTSVNKNANQATFLEWWKQWPKSVKAGDVNSDNSHTGFVYPHMGADSEEITQTHYT